MAFYPGDDEMQAQNRENALATVKEAAQFLHVSIAKLYLMMNAAEINYIKLGKCRRIPWSALEELVQRCTMAAAK
jgi:excisionase family DNA binding protein